MRTGISAKAVYPPSLLKMSKPLRLVVFHALSIKRRFPMPEHPSLTFHPTPPPPACISQTVKLLLRSPLHVLMSHQTMLITLQGRKTGKTYTVVVTYVQDGKTVFVLSRATWWKNLRGGAQVLL